MNCKPGDLARIIDHPVTRYQGVVDAFVVVKSLRSDCMEHMWIIEHTLKCGCGCGGTIGSVSDEVLRPIRDPGDEETDEMLQLLGKPNEVVV